VTLLFTHSVEITDDVKSLIVSFFFYVMIRWKKVLNCAPNSLGRLPLSIRNQRQHILCKNNICQTKFVKIGEFCLFSASPLHFRG